MSASQLRTYKHKSIELIDEILLSPPTMNSHSSVATYLSSFSSDESIVIIK